MSYKSLIKRPPGLADGEAAVKLDSGHSVAIAVEKRWLGNNAGISFRARARWIDDSGETQLCPNGQKIMTEVSHSADAASVKTLGADAIAKEMLLTVLGEEATLIERRGDDGPFQSPMLMHGDDWRLNASIRHAIAAAGATAPKDPAALLANE